MAIITFSEEEKSTIVSQVQKYFQKELDQDLGQFDAEFLLDFFAEKIGVYFYNRGLNDAQNVLTGKLADLALEMEEALDEIEKPTELSK
ncbi:DUF2164 domain-containing protein [Thalassomonas actiniarum]|uniref:DUF2164 domain-containing protein n=1 Tax=Thalassomonas actiniarum TaxID=485447 RepID=A0AAE9YUI5_9GAMM|nr:DUF2164 domain-containing protein [Thalassomonas actiniarum]WDD99896.1 DUF2164 domain-containing protein [Thalassomonas actiniarum]